MKSFDDKERRTLVTDERHTVELAPGNAAGSQAQAPSVETPALGRGTPLDRYVVLDPLGAGGMGMVYAAYDSVLDRKVALKLLPPESASGSSEVTSGRARLLREAQAMARLSHPNVVAVYDVYQHGAQVFMAMELVEGQTLSQWLREKPRGKREILSAWLEAGRGLAAAHAAGLVHRDFKPTNVLVGKDGRVRVTDFGLARPHSAPPEPASEDGASSPSTGPVKPHSLLDLQLTQWGAVLGTPAYMAPEQFRGATADARTDQFSFAVSLWEALYGERPFEGRSPAERRENVLAGRIHPPPSHSRVPPFIHRALSRALSTAPEARYPTLDALLDVLGKDPARLRRRWLSAAALSLLVTGSGALVWSTWNQRQAHLCTGAPEKLADIWDTRRQTTIEQSFLASNRPYARDTWERVREALNTYASAWTTMHRDTCVATRIRGEQSETVMSLRMACLESRRQELAALTQVFTEADDTVVEKAISAASALKPLLACADVEGLMAEVKPPEDGPTRKAVETARARLARVQALTEAGKYKQALELAEEVERETGKLDYKPVHAEALFTRALSQILSGAESQDVPQRLTQALLLAYASRHDTLAVAASVRMMGLYSRQGPQEQAEIWERVAQASLERQGEHGELRASFFNNQGMSHYRQGRFAEAYESFDKAFALAQRQLGPANAITWRYATNSQAALGYLDRGDESLRALEELVRMGEKTVGPLHPLLAQPLMNLANTYMVQGRYADARIILERVRKVGEQAYQPVSEDWAIFHFTYGDLESHEGRDAEALGHYEEGLRLYLKLTGSESTDVLRLLARVGETQKWMERLSESQQTFQQVVERARKDLKQHKQVYIQGLNGLASLHEVRGQHDKALKLRQQALELREGSFGPEHFLTALLRMDLASSHIELGQAARALAIYEKELPLFEKTVGLDSPTGIVPLLGKGEALLRLGRAPEALPFLERALQVLESRSGRPEFTASARLVLAHALWSAGQQPERALRLATMARATFSRTPRLHARELARLETLLKRHAPGSAPPGPLARPSPP
jgi:serine/threonine protein kinase/Flp pilus assembly protein TadD